MTNLFLTFLGLLIAGSTLRYSLGESFGPTLADIAGGGAGALVTLFIQWVRPRLEPWVNTAWASDSFQRIPAKILGYLLFTPRWTRWTVAILTVFVAAAATFGVEFISGRTINEAVAIGWAYVSSQLVHALKLDDEPKIAAYEPSLKF